jgi:NAD+ diphosphatase
MPVEPGQPILLGLEDGRPLFALDADEASEGGDEASEGGDEASDGGDEASDGGDEASDGELSRPLTNLREAGAELEHSEAGLAAYLTALLNWHRRHRHCANCGAPTNIEEAGYSRRCPRCGAHHFPRTDPVVIMTVSHRDRLLLGRRAGWPAGRLSVLAGFISPGESAEEAVVREVREESGILARDPHYVASQPWPFPASLMLGFDALSDGGDPAARDGELEEVHWFPLAEVRDAVREENPRLLLPPPVSIARFLIERWVARQG